MDGNRLIVALKDEEDLKTFSMYLKETGFDVTAVNDGASALEHAMERPPSLIISELDLPLVSGEKLFKIIRNNPHTSGVPFLFVSNAVADIKGFRTGRDIFLARPINLEEMYGRIRQTLSVRESVATGAKEIEGRLSHMSLPDIIQFLFLNKKEGELRIKTQKRSGSVYIKDGELYNAYTGGVEKEKALFRLLLWNEGKFEFIPMPVTVSRKVRGSVSNLLMEGMRQADEFKKMSAQFPGKKSILRRGVAASLPQGLAPVVYDVVQLCGTYPRVEDLVEHCGYPDFIVYKTITALLGKKVLVDEGAGQQSVAEYEGILPPEKMISLREKIISRFADIFNLNYGKILLVSTSGAPAAVFIDRCATLPGFSVNRKSAFFQISMENPLGAAGSLEIYGGMDLLLYAVPEAGHMGPLWRAFGSNAVGLVLLWDDAGAGEIERLEAAKRDILSRTRVPVAYVYSGGGSPDGAAVRKTFGLKPDEGIFTLAPDGGGTLEVFISLFNKLLKDDYINA
ncbi:MAG: DUF4388 domain-containing protein [Deltaproteobacteria bacterium]|nr:DUF4388 domain-containing protein [Deltaproteobacteria bacterium]